LTDISAEITGNGGSTEAAVESTTTQFDPTSSFSFEGASAAALALMDGTPQGEQAAPVAQAAQPAVESVTDTTTASDAQLAQLKPTDLVSVEVDGQEVTMLWSEARGGVMRQAKFTKEMQALRKEQTAFEANREQTAQHYREREAMVQLLNSEELVKQFLGAKYPQLLQAAQQAAGQPAQQSDPDDIATVGQVEAVAKTYAENVSKMVEELRVELRKEVVKETQKIEDLHETARLSSEINTTIDGLFKDHPYISKVIPNANEVLRWQVSQLKPKNAQEALEGFKSVFGGWVEEFKSAVTEANKGAVIQKQKLVGNNIQPPGGAPVQPQPTSFVTKDGKPDWDKLREAALNTMGS